jgi:hypothetical protein
MLGRRDDLLERIAEANRLTERPEEFAGSPFRNTPEAQWMGSPRFRMEASSKTPRLSVMRLERQPDDARAWPVD